MNYNKNITINQSNSLENENILYFPSLLNGFINTSTSRSSGNNKDFINFEGYINPTHEDYICPSCGSKMHINNKYNVSLKHLPIGGVFSFISLPRIQFFCPKCHISKLQDISFKNEHHFITNELFNYITDLLTFGFTLKEVSNISGVNKNIIKQIDKQRLLSLYSVDGKGEKLIVPPKAQFLAIDEFKLHNGYKYASHIIDLDSGHIIWIAKGKKKKVVADFINFVGLDWISSVKAVACDMNSDFEEEFKDKAPHIKIVYDFFHISKNFNDKLLNEVRKDLIHDFSMKGLTEDLKLLKHGKYVLLASKDTLIKRDKLNMKKNKLASSSSSLFDNSEDKILRTDNLERYNKILSSNKLLFIADYLKDELKLAYSLDDEEKMLNKINDIISTCNNTKNEHFIWFANLLSNHIDGIISHAAFNISSGKIEGINNKIKTIRRKSYGIPDDEYFFLKCMDASRQNIPFPQLL